LNKSTESYYLITRNNFISKIIGKIVARAAQHIDNQIFEKYETIYKKFSSYTRVSQKRYYLNLLLAEEFLHVDGCIVECGAWKGGMIAGLVSIMGPEQSYYLFDSFEGLPDAKSIDGDKAKDWKQINTVDNCGADEKDAHESMKFSGAESYHIIRGGLNPLCLTLRKTSIL